MQAKHLPTNAFKIYSASAGSGKTYQLTKAYLKLILSPSSKQKYRSLLAITFTNKAVAEMKQRILESLYAFSQDELPNSIKALFKDILEEVNISPAELRLKSKQVLKELLHNYAFFEISTIDKFTHKIIRTFARDLKISQGFDVVLDTDALLEEAVGRILNKAGENAEFTKVLLDFSLEKIDDDKSWNIAYDLFEIGKLLFQENHYTYLKSINTKEISDFVSLKSSLNQKIKEIEKEIVLKAGHVLEQINQKGFEYSDFPRESLPNHFRKLALLDFNSKALYGTKLQDNLIEGKILKANNTKPATEIIAFLLQEFLAIKELFYKHHFLKNSYKNIVPLTVLNEITKEVKALQKEKDILPISEFNTIIAKEIKTQPVPFIYERLGEKYRHYFIDEFQDTSQMQWENLIPLIGNALESENEKGEQGSLLLVGDPKQAIYRWRGGRAEQFLNILNLVANPFVISPNIKNLETNWRSHKEIIDFNNSFFNFAAKKLSNPSYKTFFEEGNKQKTTQKTSGYVEIAFTENTEDSYCESTLEIIQNVVANEYALGDICILVRDNKKGAILADFLTEKEISIISSDSLLLANNKEVSFLVSLLQLIENSENEEAIYALLDYLHEGISGKHDFIRNHIRNSEKLLHETYGFHISLVKKQPIYDILEQAILCFKLAGYSNAHVSHFMDEVFDFSQKEDATIFSFLNYWSRKSNVLSVKAPENLNAVQIMTVHKAKGLEFPVVIFPFANAKIVDSRSKKLWLPVNKDAYNGFNNVLINSNKELLNYNDTVVEIYNDELSKLELDAFNVLYVALTRAKNALFIITDEKSAKDTYSELFKTYVENLGRWQDSKLDYSFGHFDKKEKQINKTPEQESIPYIYTHKNKSSFKIVAKANNLWDAERQEAIQKGNLIHKALSKVHYQNDVTSAIASFKNNGDVTSIDIPYLEEKLNQIIFHPELTTYFDEKLTVYNEKELLTPEGLLLRPDRLVVENNSVTIIDYKTGGSSETHKNQLLEYASVLERMDYVVKDMILIYINESIKPIFI